MAGETLLSANSSTGVYVLQDNNGWKGNNTPNTCNLGGDTGLELASGYMYFDDFEEVVTVKSTPVDSGYLGWEVTQRTGTETQKSQAFCGEAVATMLVVSVLLDSTKAANLEKFFDYCNDKDSNQYYFVRQWASTTFREFSYSQTLYKYLPIIFTDCMVNETNTGGKFVLSGQLTLRVATVVT
jgi:hypothetical protein